MPKSAQGEACTFGKKTEPAVGLFTRKPYVGFEGSAQRGVQYQSIWGLGCDGSSVIFRLYRAPFPPTFDGSEPLRPTMAATTEIVVVHDSPGTVGLTGTRKAPLPAPALRKGVPSATPHVAAPAGLCPATTEATDAAAVIPPIRASAASERTIRDPPSRPTLAMGWHLLRLPAVGSPPLQSMNFTGGAIKRFLARVLRRPTVLTHARRRRVGHAQRRSGTSRLGRGKRVERAARVHHRRASRGGGVREARDRVRAAVLSSGLPCPLRLVTVDLDPSRGVSRYVTAQDALTCGNDART